MEKKTKNKKKNKGQLVVKIEYFILYRHGTLLNYVKIRQKCLAWLWLSYLIVFNSILSQSHCWVHLTVIKKNSMISTHRLA